MRLRCGVLLWLSRHGRTGIPASRGRVIRAVSRCASPGITFSSAGSRDPRRSASRVRSSEGVSTAGMCCPPVLSLRVGRTGIWCNWTCAHERSGLVATARLDERLRSSHAYRSLDTKAPTMTYANRNLGALPLGELHDKARCARCGQRGVSGEALMRTVLVSTHAVAVVCKDTHECLRRRTNKKKGRV